MRIFWAVIIILLAATIGLVLASGRGSGPGVEVAGTESAGTASEQPAGRAVDSGLEPAVPALEAQAPAALTQPPASEAVPGSVATPDADQPGQVEASTDASGGAPAASVPVDADGPVHDSADPRGATPATDPAAPGTSSEQSGHTAGPVTSGAPASQPVPASPGITEPSAEAPASADDPAAEVPAPTEAPAPTGGESSDAPPSGDNADPGAAVTTNAPVPPPIPALPPDTAATRSAMGLLTNVVTQSQIAPGADFIGRLAAAASGFWSDAPEVKAAVPGAARAFRITSPSGGSPVFVADNGAGNDVTIIVPRPDLDLVHSMLQAAVQLSLAPPGADEPGTPAEPGAERYGVTLNGEPAGLLTILPVLEGPGAGGVAITFHATTPIPLAAAADGAEADIAYEVQPDGSLKLANGVVIQGNGTPERPYAVTWDLLVSTERVYQPRNGLTGLPRWCSALHERHVRITGHLLSPLMMDDTKQILLMRNQWDGCCVGVPPTPYDAIEVELSRPVSLVREQLNYGTITGVLEVDPYLVNNWLVGLWILSEARIDSSGAQNWAVPAGPN